VKRGIVLYSAKVLTLGKTWGEDFILEQAALQSLGVARAMTFVEVYALSRAHLLKAVESYHIANRLVRPAAHPLCHVDAPGGLFCEPRPGPKLR
jgi:hypothetical protein